MYTLYRRVVRSGLFSSKHGEQYWNCDDRKDEQQHYDRNQDVSAWVAVITFLRVTRRCVLGGSYHSLMVTFSVHFGEDLSAIIILNSNCVTSDRGLRSKQLEMLIIPRSWSFELRATFSLPVTGIRIHCLMNG